MWQKYLYMHNIYNVCVWNYLNNLHEKRKITRKKILQNDWLIYTDKSFKQKNEFPIFIKYDPSFQTTSWYCWQDFILCHSHFPSYFVYLLHTCFEHWKYIYVWIELHTNTKCKLWAIKDRIHLIIVIICTLVIL